MTFRTKFLIVCFDLRTPKSSHNRLRCDIVPRLSLFSKVSYTSNSDPTSFILNERETRFASGKERDRSDLSRSIRHQEVFEPQPGNFG